MKTLIAILSISILFLSSCLQNELEDLTPPTDDSLMSEIPFDFDFKTIKSCEVEVRTDYHGAPIRNMYVEAYYSNPINSDGELDKTVQGSCVYKGTTDYSGKLKFKLATPTIYDSLYIYSTFPGINPLAKVALTEGMNIVQMGSKLTKKKNSTQKKNNSIPDVNIVNNFYTLGNWNGSGTPTYFEDTGDNVSLAFLEQVAASLPEGSALPNTHPQYLTNGSEANLTLVEDGEVWVTFVTEGAGWKNTLGYYTYSSGNPPNSVDQIRDKTIIFPNISLENNILNAGNKVQLFYLDPTTNTYSATFPSGTSVGWFLLARGWANSSITNGSYQHYSNTSLNAETDDNLKKHNVLLYDEERELLVLGFEDVPRNLSSCDQDFNDAVFYTTVSPFTAVQASSYQPIDSPTDTDADGVSDVFDEYPNNANLAFNNHYPNENDFGTLVYEDLWPFRGDYDFNDLVLDYNFKHIMTASNLVSAIEIQLVVRAIGASYHNGLGIQLNVDPQQVASVTGQSLTENNFDIASNGCENNQSKATVILFDNAYRVLQFTGEGVFINTYEEYAYTEPDTLTVQINFQNPQAINSLGLPPYNPFLIVNRDRGVEVHLPGSPPTDLANTALFGTGNDNTNLNSGIYYKSEQYLPWGINIPVSFNYPNEKSDIRDAYTMFNAWVSSGGFNYMDWYIQRDGYQNSDKIYSK